MVHRAKLKAALRALGEWLDTLPTEATARPPQTEGTFSGLAFSQNEEGTVVLTATEADEYRDHLANLIEAVCSTEDVSQSAVEAAYREAIFVVLDPRKRRSRDPKERRALALQELELYLTGPLHHFQVTVPIQGLAGEGLPTTVGRITLALFDDERAAGLHTIVASRGGSVPADLVEQWGPPRGGPVAIVEVDAFDWEAARARALREVRLTLDVVNFFSSLVPYNDSASLSLPGDATTAKMRVALLQQEGAEWAQYKLDNQWVGALGEVSMSRLAATHPRISSAFAYASSLLATQRNALQQRVVAALQWAGRAAVDSRREGAFLLHAIALEALLLAEGNKVELGYRLSLRVAHLLGKTVEDRRDLLKRVTGLYGVRSAIVHNGDYQVTEGELGVMRLIAAAALIRVCTNEEFRRMSNGQDLAHWFQEKILEVGQDPG